MNKYVYTITTILFLGIAVLTVYFVLEKDKTDATETANIEVTAEDEELEPVIEEPVTEEPVIDESVIDDSDIEETPEQEEPIEDEETEYYIYTVKGASSLNLRPEQGKANEPVATLPKGYTGYVLKMTGHWTLICADGYAGYCSDSFLNLEEIPSEDFPEELKGYDESSAGTKIAEGKIGEVENSNTKSVKWL